MVVYQPELDWPPSDCGTIQGILRPDGIGAIQNVGVTPDHRGQGIGRALVVTMLRADRAAGLTASVLAARHTGAKLYSAVGYQTAGTVLVLTPAKR